MFILKKFQQSGKELGNIFNMTVSAMLLAIRVILGFFTVLITPTIKIGFSFLPVALSGMLYGPVVAGAIGGLGDILSYIVNPAGGAYFPGFTISGIIAGIIYGLFLYQKEVKLIRIILCKLVILVVVDLTLTTMWLCILNDKAFFVLLSARLVKNLILFPIEIAMIYGGSILVKTVNLPKLASNFKHK